MPLWKLLKISREILSTWRGLQAAEKERVRSEALRVRRLASELAHLAGPLGKQFFAGEQQITGDDAPAAHATPEHGQRDPEHGPRDIKLVSKELLDAVIALGAAIGPGTFEAAQKNSPRSLRAAARLGSAGVRKAKQRWG